MEAMTETDPISRLGEERCVAILRTRHAAGAAPAMEAALRGGFRIVEFTLGTPGALDLVQAFAARGDCLVGVGTVLTETEARAAVAAGAAFLVSPVVDESIMAVARSLGVPMIPGCQTPTEMLRAHRAGAPVQKVFPAATPAQLASCLGPLPFLRLLPTSGVDADNAAAYLQAGCFAVGFVSSLFSEDDIAAGRFDRIERRARTLLPAVQAHAQAPAHAPP
jgi:2-dehydro-3-deoxyphosphogluconate aldolase / (4S)-4-hydroxy-2-oxoglutarate aldolase